MTHGLGDVQPLSKSERYHTGLQGSFRCMGFESQACLICRRLKYSSAHLRARAAPAWHAQPFGSREIDVRRLWEDLQDGFTETWITSLGFSIQYLVSATDCPGFLRGARH
jgi:hypothetical protein